MGSIKCDYLNTLLKDYEINGPTTKNPIPIIDTSRLSGINKNHPFTKHLFRLPQERIMHILTELQYEEQPETKINASSLLSSINDLKILGTEIFNKLDIELLSDLYYEEDKGNKFVSNDVQHTGKEKDLRFSKTNINKRRKTEKQELQTLVSAGSDLDINFVEKTFPGKYQTNLSNRGITINIPLTHSIINRYLGTEEEGYPGKNDTRFLIALADIITESFADMLADNEISLLNNNMEQQEVINYYNQLYDKYYDIYQDRVYKIILD